MQLHDSKTDRFTHQSNLPLASFVKDYFDLLPSFGTAQDLDLARRCLFPLDDNSLFELACLGFRYLLVKDRFVDLLHAKPWMRQLVGKRAVIADQKNACRVPIESSNRIQPARNIFEELQHGFPAVRISSGRDDIFGFVKQVIQSLGGGLDPFTLIGNLIFIRKNRI
jgi:hypothetical protein